jgi:hypothetical protein
MGSSLPHNQPPFDVMRLLTDAAEEAVGATGWAWKGKVHDAFRAFCAYMILEFTDGEPERESTFEHDAGLEGLAYLAMLKAVYQSLGVEGCAFLSNDALLDVRSAIDACLVEPEDEWVRA